MGIAIVLFILGFVLLVKGGDWFVDGATGIARRFGIPELLIGATVVSIGTTLPEVMVSATSAFGGHGEIAYGNAIGSIICNTALVAAITIALKPAGIDRESIKLPVIFFFISAVFYSATAYTTGYFSRITGFILLGLFIFYMFFSIKKTMASHRLAVEHDLEPQGNEADINAIWKDIIFLALGAGLIAVGADLLVDNGTIIAAKLGIPEAVIALTFVALGTSLPELVTAITSIAKGHGALSLGNVIGANLFNLILVSGVASVVSPFSIPEGNTVGGFNSSLVIDIPVMLFVMSFLIIPGFIRGRLVKAQGYILLAVYFTFCIVQFLI